jgi:hypothetical protein
MTFSCRLTIGVHANADLGKCRAGGNTVDVDTSLRVPLGQHAGTRFAPTREAAMSAFAKSWRRGANNDDARHRSLGGVFSLMRRSKVRFRGQTGEHLLSPSFTGFDRERSSGAFIGLAYRP